MLKNYLKTALRNFKNNKSFALLNIFGLGMGLACCLFVFTVIKYEESFDDWHTNKDRIYRVVNHYYGDNGLNKNGIIPYPTGDAIIANIPDFEKVVQFHGPNDEKFSLTDHQGNLQVFREEQVLYTDENFFDVMDFEIVSGADGKVLGEPFKIILTESMATKYYGDANPIGQTIKINSQESVEVAAVMKDPPTNTNLPFNCIVSMPTLRKRYPDIFKDNWGMTWAYSVYVLVRENANIDELEAKLETWENTLHEDSEEDQAKTIMKLQPLSDIHTNEEYGDGNNYVTPSLMIYAFIILGSLILGTACLNFINLSTAQAVKRSKEVGIRKTLGSRKGQLVMQFLLETFLIVAVAILLAFTAGQVMIKQLNSYLADINYSLQFDGTVILFGILMTILVTVLAGFYPSMILAGYQPVKALNNQINLRKGTGSFNFRRVLVIAQFAFTILVLVSTIIISEQMRYVSQKDLGFDFKNVVTIAFPDDVEVTKLETIEETFRAKPYVEKTTKSFQPPMAWSNWNQSYNLPGEEYIDGNNANMKFADQQYIDFYDLNLLAGQNIRDQKINDTTYHAVVNQKFVESLGWEKPEEAIGQWIDINGRTKIIGVIDDFHMWSLRSEIGSAMVLYKPDMLDQIGLRLNTPHISDHMQDIESTFRTFFPNELFEFYILENQIAEYYEVEALLNTVIQIVSFLSILLSAMGLYGLVSFMANQNAKNIGVRKVFGASTGQILRIFAKEYVALLLIAFFIAFPLAWYLVGLWIEEFAYRIEISPVYFIVGFILTLLIALMTVGFRSYQAANANPIQSLRYE